MATRYNPGLVTDGLVLHLDAANPKSYPGAGYNYNLTKTWTDYGSNSANYSVLGSTYDNHSVLIKNTSTAWIGYFPADPVVTGWYTIDFTYYTDTGTSTLILDNDGIMDNTYNGTYTATTTPQRARVSINHTTTGNIKFFFRRNAGSNIWVTNVNFYRSDRWYDLAGNYEFTLNSPSTWIPNGWGQQAYMDFNNGIAKNLPGGTLTDVAWYPEVTYCIFSTVKSPDGDWKTLTRSQGGDHHVIISQGDGISLGMYDNDGGGFQDTGFDVNSMPNYTTQFNFMAWRLNNQRAPYYEFFYNQNTSSAVASLSSASSVYNRGFASVGAYHNGNSTPTSFGQEFGQMSVFAYYKRLLGPDELAQNYQALKGRFGI